MWNTKHTQAPRVPHSDILFLASARFFNRKLNHQSISGALTVAGDGRLKATNKQTTAGGRATEQQWQHSDHVLDDIISNVMGEFASTEKVAHGAFVLPLRKRSGCCGREAKIKKTAQSGQ